QGLEDLARKLAPLDGCRGVRAVPQAALRRLREDGVQHAAQDVEALGRQVVRTRLQELLDAGRRHARRGPVAEPLDQMLPQERLPIAALAGSVFLPPPVEQVTEGAVW